MALVTASGTLGLNAFFPPKETTITAPELGPGDAYPKYLPPPHLPLTPTWHEADYSLPNILSTTALPGEQVDIRQYCMRLLSRYLYLDGESPNVSKTLACFQFCNAKKKKKKREGLTKKFDFSQIRVSFPHDEICRTRQKSFQDDSRQSQSINIGYER